jgi:hypothetical protein
MKMTRFGQNNVVSWTLHLKKKREEARNGVVLNDIVLLLLPLDVQQGKKKVFEFVFFPHSLSLPNLTKH